MSSRQVAYVTSRTGASSTTLKIKAARRKSSVNTDRQLHRFKVLWHIYSHCSRGRRVVVLPGDLEAAIRFRKLHSSTFKQCPALFVASLRGKELPWYEALQKAWRQLKGVSRSGVTKSAVSYHDVATVLQGAARLMVGVNRKAFVENLGRNVSHHSGWLPFLLQKGLLRKWGGSSRRSGVLHFGGSGHYTIAPITATVLSKIQAMGATGQTLLNLAAPRTIQDWDAAVLKAKQDAPKSETSAQYVWPWLVRATLISAMRNSGVERLQCHRNATVSELSGLFPDQKQHLTRFAKTSDTITELTGNLAYDGPVELLTMYLCFFCSREMASVCPDKLERSQAELIRKREGYVNTHGLAPHAYILGRWA